jgi:hypothetical protein
MLKNLFTVFIVFTFFLISCKDDAFTTVKSSGELSFSRDTIFLDTIFTGISSSTYTLKVYNKSSDHITIPSVKLGRGEASFYRLNIDGIAGKSFEDIDILSRDSIFIFVEATIDYSKVTNPIYSDSIVFDTGSNQQDVKLVTLVQDAHFLYPKRNAEGVKEKIVLGINSEGEEIAVEGFYLDANTTWKDDKPYVIYGYAGVPKNGKLTIEQGARIHFHQNSGLLVDKGATLKVDGGLNDNVIFEGDRLEPGLSEIPGQWGTIWLRAGSRNHEFKNVIIKNNTLGILMDSVGSLTEPTLKLHNVQIYNTGTFGIMGRTAHIKGDNMVIANNGKASIACTIGGSYDFTHITIANYWIGNVREYPALLINNYLEYTASDGSQRMLVRDLKKADFTNCIIEGNKDIEMILSASDQGDFDYNFKNNLIKFYDPNGRSKDNPLFDFENTGHYQNNIFNGISDFKNKDMNEFIIGVESDAVGKADQDAAVQVPLDLLGIDRTIKPDMGAYQHIIFEE